MQTQSTTARSTAVRFGPNYGYRFNGDSVELHASVQILNDEAHQTSWALQLRASPAYKSTPEPLATHLVAEVQLLPFNQFACNDTPFYLTATAAPPAGSGEFNLYLVLASKDSAGETKSHDVAFFDHPERFVQPRFTGEVSHQITGDHVRLSIASLENPRDPANLSGTLALELWALTAPYAGGTFQGTPLAGTMIGYLAGQENLLNLAYDLTLTPPPPGRWQLVLMLREWTSNGFTTRDYFNFTLPLEVTAPIPATPELILQTETAAPKVMPSAPTKPTSKTVKAPAAKKAAAQKTAKTTNSKKAAPAAKPARTTPSPAAKRTSR